jgi:hypothetical protein
MAGSCVVHAWFMLVVHAWFMAGSGFVLGSFLIHCLFVLFAVGLRRFVVS